MSAITLSVALGLSLNRRKNAEVPQTKWPGQDAPRPRVEIIIPVRDEERNIGPLLDTLCAPRIVRAGPTNPIRSNTQVHLATCADPERSVAAPKRSSLSHDARASHLCITLPAERHCNKSNACLLSLPR